MTFFDFNDVCKPAPLDTLYAAIWAHEGFGNMTLPDGQANGHERVRRVNALLNDPTSAIEPLLLVVRQAIS